MPLDPEFHADLAACRALLCDGSRTFFAASRVLPARVSGPATALYAFCRIADDLVDRGVDPTRASDLPLPLGEGRGEGGARLDRQGLDSVRRPHPTLSQRERAQGCGETQYDPLDVLRDRLDRIYAGPLVALPEDRALARVVAHFALPRALLDALLEGFAWDAASRQYETLEDVQDYAARVAGTVGAMMAVLMGARTPALVARACDLGAAMQLTNIARDVGEDARAGRLYLPRAWLREAGVDPDAWLSQPSFTPAIGAVVKRLLNVAEGLYAHADAGIAGLPWDCRPGIRAARLLYAQIGAQVAANGFDSITRRAVVPARRKARLLGNAVMGAFLPVDPVNQPPLPACRHLVQAVPAAPRQNVRPTFDDRVAWLFNLFARLEQQQMR